MRTETIFSAMGKAIDEHRWPYVAGALPRRRRLRRQITKFRSELLRRMAHYDAIRGPWVESLR